ncbi:ATP synthase mitochondrial F1 complex assembly factor 1, putative [Babesia ovis]|uniref:ATP synthase mitochondrial F1 complex assembly factor 1, putative n=1 Tax=Babesia ovis TaxID=5869 RepID=A0A9W5TCH4_BABOV|nr:ATP synthase mitochondrial F1 complex assembly factor 1, putative [Babesia ovis]
MLQQRLVAISTRYACLSRRWLSLNADAFARVRLRDKTTVSLCHKYADVVDISTNFAISLDGSLLESPLGNLLQTPSRAVAERVVSEWRKHIGQLTRFATLPATLLLSETVDLNPAQREILVKSLVEALDFDTALRFDVQPTVTLPPIEDVSMLDSESWALIAKLDLDVLQSSYLAPILRTFAARRGTSELVNTGSVESRLQQPKDVVENIHNTLYNASDAKLISIDRVHKCLKSVILPLELFDGAIDAKRAVRASRLEEVLQAASWGISPEFQDKETAILQQIEEALEYCRAQAD